MDGIDGIMERLMKLAGDIKPLEMLVKEEIGGMDDKTFWKQVCHAVIADGLDEVPLGTHLFQCAWSNREIFSERNAPHHYMIANDPGVVHNRPEHGPEIQVNIAQLARFAMPCPYEGTQRCPLRHFQFGPSDEAKHHDSKLEW